MVNFSQTVDASTLGISVLKLVVSGSASKTISAETVVVVVAGTPRVER